jgi:3-hydroxyisobutyrate dehydrogenase
MNIAFLGTGLMGLPMAENLIKSGNKLTVYNRTISKTEPLADLGAEVCETAAEAIAKNDVIISMLTDYSAFVESVLKNKENDLTGKQIIQMSTISPKQSKDLFTKINERGGEYLEAPVLGSIQQVKDKSLFILAGGEKILFEKFRPLFAELGDKIYLVGDVGSAAALKLALNQLIASLTSAFSMSFAYLKNNSGNTELFMKILRGSALYAPTFDKKLSNIENRNYSSPNFPLKHLLKDVNLILDGFNESGVNTEPLIGVQSFDRKSN